MWTTKYFNDLYQTFLESGKTVKQFCQEAQVEPSRFYRWQRKLRQEAACNPNGEFMPVSINNRGGKVVLMDKNHPFHHRSTTIQQPVCEICFPNGVTLRLNGSIPLEAISGLIMLPR
ncbi:MAG: hypothetical protein IK119_09805 [Bacteroidales bacterium]|nr:hypothetical protein [Bacteroidales bacterium]